MTDQATTEPEAEQGGGAGPAAETDRRPATGPGLAVAVGATVAFTALVLTLVVGARPRNRRPWACPTRVPGWVGCCQP